MNRTMTKEEYVASIKELEEIIAKYREQEKQLKNQYIDENKQFEVNENYNSCLPAGYPRRKWSKIHGRGM